MLRRLVILAAVLGTVGTVRALSPEVAREASSRVDPAKIEAHVAKLAGEEMRGRRSGTPGAKLAVAYIAKTFEEVGLKPVDGKFVVDDGEDSVLGMVPGTDKKDEAVVISAHWDGVGEDDSGKMVPGADENASGVSALLEIARVLAKTSPRRTIVFASFGGFWDPRDEAVRFRGARAFASKPRGGLKPVFMVDLMTVGVPLMPAAPERFFILGSETSQAGLDVAKELGAATELKLARASIELVEKRGPRDDYDAFRAAGVPFLFLTSGVTRFYHKPGDEPKTVDPKRIAAAARLAIDAAARVDAMDATPAFAKGDALRDDKADAAEVLALLEAALDPKTALKMSESERRALTSKRDRAKEMLSAKGPLSVRERGMLKDTLELLLVVLTK